MLKLIHSFIMENARKKGVAYWLGLVYTLLTISSTVVMAILKIFGYVSYGWGEITAPVWASLLMALAFVFLFTLVKMNHAKKWKK